MAKRSTSRPRASKPRPVPADPVALRARFLSLKARKSIEHLEGIKTPPPDSPEMIFRNKTVGEVAIEAFVRYRWCRDAETALDDGTEFLSEYGGQLEETERGGYVDQLVELLDLYGAKCTGF
jgi:hypothetical protein